MIQYYTFILGTNISGALRRALQLVAKQDYGTNGIEEAEAKHYIDSQTVPQPMMIFLTDGIATIGELVTGRILAQVRAVNTEIKVYIQIKISDFFLVCI
mgnify:CR=1 FL=1